MMSGEFRPDWASAPGDTIAEILRERELSRVDFAQQLGYTPQAAADLLEGRATITIATARKLSKVLGASVEFWMTRDFQYRQDIERLRAGDQEWLSELPVGDMIKLGWLVPVPRPSEELAACLRFFNVPTVQAWKQAYSSLHAMAAFRTSPSFDSRPAAVATWLRQGEILASQIECRPWNATRFEESLARIRPLTRHKDPKRFLAELSRLGAESGVAIVVARAPSGCRASGATRFLSRDKALLMLSFRYLTDDQFWFTFFHEAGHLVLHSGSDLFLEGFDTPSTAQEQEANAFAARILIPPERQPELMALRADSQAVIRFAVRVGVSPGIVVGQLQHLGKIKHSSLNRLKRHYTWES